MIICQFCLSCFVSRKQRDRSASTSSIESDHSEGNALRPKSSRRASNVRSVPLSAGASSSTSPTPPFSGPTGVNKIQIRRKTRWGPTLEEKTQPSRTDAKKKRRKESVEDFRGKKNKFRPLLDFVDNPKQLASEVLSSLDVRTRNRIFPELKGMLEPEATMLVYGLLKGISRKRIVALMQSENLSNSSSTSESDDNLCVFPSTSSDQQNHSSPATTANPTPLCKHPTKSSRLLKEKQKRAGAKKFKMARRMEKGNGGEELEEGEVRSSAEEEEDEMKNGSSSMPTVYNDERRDNTTDGDEGEADEDDKFVHVAPSVDGTELNGRDEHVHHQQFKPQFVISLNCSPPLVESESVGDVHDDECDFGEFEQQRIVCILPPSPTATVVVGIHSDDHMSDDDHDDRQQQKTSIDYCQMEQSLQVQITLSDEESKEEGVLGHVEAIREPDLHAGRRITLYDKTPEDEDEEPDIELIE